jgi:hypothetical protein
VGKFLAAYPHPEAPTERIPENQVPYHKETTKDLHYRKSAANFLEHSSLKKRIMKAKKQ